ncbi:MAG TPA: transglutaminase family protein [Blastocatellia bacterium]|nr:transglutaminase family protein [Blastocatellia bacterium]HMV82669.1 transglutaminase family protein [Blastocatellia bacterium]HMY76295.1 transglutaminase family protein [Blastocatellia bacterium]HMZ16814.1 transglutaminase family protein [Blastocatellia bacterium]HNG32284.1 transglutaminase family protein [Blastocatellia bacterium]
MFYSIRHITRFTYSAPVTESVTEVRMQPRSEGNQRCVKFDLTTQPRTRIQGYRDYLGNVVHHFDIPGKHNQLKITAEATVEISPLPVLPESLPADAWAQLDAVNQTGEHWDYLTPSNFAFKTGLLAGLAAEFRVERRGDPLSLLREINTAIYETFDYAPQSTSVDSPIDDSLEERRGVCQDFAHIMIALVREVKIPCRYVSGYLYHGREDHDRSAADATHAWVEAFLPELGWIGFDPTNNLLAGERHIRTAVGKDYADVPPTRGVFKGSAQSELSVGVQVAATEAPPPEDELMAMTSWIAPPPPVEDDQQQQQQQQ